MGERFMYKLAYGNDLAKQLKDEVGLQNLRKINQNIGIGVVQANQSNQNDDDDESSQSKQSESRFENESQSSVSNQFQEKDQSENIFFQKEQSQNFEVLSQKSQESDNFSQKFDTIDINQFYEIDYDQGPEQFLKILAKSKQEKIFKLSDLYYPVYEQSYYQQKKFYIKLMGFKSENKRYDLIKQLWEHVRQKIENKVDQIHKLQEKDQPQNLFKKQQKQYIFNLKKRVKIDKELLQPQKVAYYLQKIQDNQFFDSLKQDMLSKITNPYKSAPVQEDQVVFNDFFQENFEDIFAFNSLQVASNNKILNEKDDEFLQKNKKKQLNFGQIKNLENEKFIKGNLFFISPATQKQENQYSFKNQIYQNYTYYNPDILNFQSFLQSEKSSVVEIDLNNSQLFYEKVHGVLSQQFIKKSKKNKKQLQVNETENKLLNIGLKQDKNRLKQLRIQAVKQGLDPQQIFLMEQQNKFEQIETIIEENEQQKSLQTLIDNHKKLQRQTQVSHSRIANQFIFNDFNTDHINHKNYHRFDMDPLIRKELLNKTIKIQPVRPNYKKESEILGKRKNPHNLEEITELVDSHALFKNKKRLSLIQDDFICFEYIEQHPLIMQNIGMGSKIYKYLYHQRILSQMKKQQTNEEEIIQFKDFIYQKFGHLGAIQFLDQNQKIPLIAELKQNNIGTTTIENNLFRAPIFKQKARETDFVLVRYKSETSEEFKFYLRKIEYIYVVGQIEPKMEIYSPNSRALSAYIKKSLKYAVKSRFSLSGNVDIRELAPLFSSINEHNLRKTIKDLGGEPDFFDPKVFNYNKDIVNSEDERAMVLCLFQALDDYEMRPEDTCLQEKMIAGITRLQEFGLKDLRTEDKVNVARIKFFKRYMDNHFKRAVCRNIQNELQTAPWTTSQAFLGAKLNQGRLTLIGYGDPTSGNGGFSYIKMPLKMSRHDKEEQNITQESLKVVTGTDADLRKLSMKQLHKLLAQYDLEYLNKLQRWEKIALLKQMSTSQKDDKEDLNKYQRSSRITTKMQKDNYQKDVNRLFQQMINNLTVTDFDEIKYDKIQFFFKFRNDSPLISQLVEKEKKEMEIQIKKMKEKKIFIKNETEQPEKIILSIIRKKIP